MKKGRERPKVLIFILSVCILLTVGQVRAVDVQIVKMGVTEASWSIEPFVPGFALMEPSASYSYGFPDPVNGLPVFPDLPVTGSVTLPVFLVDWSDFNPETDPSNQLYPTTTIPGYQKKTPGEIYNYLNGIHGPADYFREVSGGQLQIFFEVYPWMVSDQMTYLKNKSEYYYQNATGSWVSLKRDVAKDVLRSAIADWEVDLTQYDADNNKVLDGFVLIYEGRGGALSGTNLTSFGSQWLNGTPGRWGNLNASELVAEADPNYWKFTSQQILFNSHNNIPEQLVTTHSLSSVFTWAHELGHLLLGYRDYYVKPDSLGNYALSASGGISIPLHAAGMEKWFFAHWFDTRTIVSNGRYTLTNHHLTEGQTYSTGTRYLFQIHIDNNPDHFLTIENRHFLPPDQGGSYFNQLAPGRPLLMESGLVVFEIDRRDSSFSQIKRLLPLRVQAEPITTDKGAFQPGDELVYTLDGFELRIDNITAPDELVAFDVTFPMSLAQTPWQDNENGALVIDIGWNYAMGYNFTPQADGSVTALGGFFNGAKTVKLFNRATGELLASTTVSSANDWNYSAITPVIVTAGTEYTVAVYLAGSGGSYRSSVVALPQTYGDININGTTWVSTGSDPDARPLNNYPNAIYGQADIVFIPVDLQTPWQDNENGTLTTDIGWNYAMGYNFTPQVDGSVTALGGFFNGSKTVKMFNRATGELLASATVSSANDWNYSAITPVNVTAGTEYTVAAYLAGSGASYRNSIVALPQTYGDININGTTWASTGSDPDARPLNNYPNVIMYGQADIIFAP